MRSTYVFIFLASAAFIQCTGQSKPAAKQTNALKNRADSVGYALGNNLGEFLKAQGITDLAGNVNTDMMIKAIKDATASQAPLMSREQCSTALNNFVMAKKTESVKKNKDAGIKFLAENKKKSGIITLPSGLQYQVIKTGTGPKPTAADQVQVHYHGTLIDGTVFDSSVDRKEPMTHSASGFIKGWNEALSLMPEGSKWKLYIPSDLAYGDQAAGPQIPPGSTLVFDIELLKVNP